MRLLDLFCGAGGAGVGYARAGFEVFGVDIKPQPNNPLPTFTGDALRYLVDYGRDFDVIHASPPCQKHTQMSNRWRGHGGVADSHADWISPTRKLLRYIGKPYIIENVTGARKELIDPIRITGGPFGLNVERPRLFESNLVLQGTTKPRAQNPIGVYGQRPNGRFLWRRADGTCQYAASSVEEARAAMGIDWMDWRELCEAIPPAYTEFIGKQVLELLAG